MKYKVIKKHQNSAMCLVCGLKNRLGLQAAFYELENNMLVAIFRPKKEHQSYPGIMHGGLISTILDETIGRAIMTKHNGEIWGVTAELNVKFLKPVPLNTELKVTGRVTLERKQYFEAEGQLLLQDGSVAAAASGKFMKMALEKIVNTPNQNIDAEHLEWRVYPSPDDPTEIELNI